jgi:hypothetical protein
MTINQYLKFHLTVRDQENKIVESGVSCKVYTAGTNTLATIYSTSVGDAKTNPITTTVFATDRGVEFYAITATVDVLLEYGTRRVLVTALAPGTEHLVVISPQEADNIVRCGKIFEFDCAVTTPATKVIIPAIDNPSGLIITHIFGILTETMTGTEDQGIVVVSDESNNALATITPTNATGDAVGDYLTGYQSQSATLGDAAFVVAAGEFVDAIVTQPTTGTNTGMYYVIVEYVRL